MPSLKNKLAALVALVAIASPLLTVSLLTLSPTPPTLAQTIDPRKVEADRLVLRSNQQSRRGQLILAANSLEEALLLYQQIKDWDSVKEVLNSLYFLYGELEWYQKLETVILQLEKIDANSELKERKEYLHSEAGKWMKLENYTKAILALEELLSLTEKTGKNVEKLEILYYLGFIQLEQENYQKAVFYLEKFLSNKSQIYLSSLTKERLEYHQSFIWSALSILGDISYQRKEYLKSISYFEQLQDLVQKPFVSNPYNGDINFYKGSSLIKKARGYLALGENSRAISLLKEAIAILNEL